MATYPYTLSSNDSLVQIDTRNILNTSSNIVIYLPNFLTSNKVNVRDIGGNTIYFKSYSVILSTLNCTFNDGTSSYYINTPYESASLSQDINTSNWIVLNSMYNSTIGIVNSANVTSNVEFQNSLYAGNIICSGNISTLNLNTTGSILIGNNALSSSQDLQNIILNTSNPPYYVTSSILNTNITNMASQYLYISTSQFTQHMNAFATTKLFVSTPTLVSSLTHMGSQYGYISSIASGSSGSMLYHTSGDTKLTSSSNLVYYISSLTQSPTISTNSISDVITIASKSQYPFPSLQTPYAIAVGIDGSIYITDSTNHLILIIQQPDNKVSIIGGSVGKSGYVNGVESLFNAPSGIAVDSLNNVYVSDTGNSVIRIITLLNGKWTSDTFAGQPSSVSGYLDGIVGNARFYLPTGMTISKDGTSLYICDSGNKLIRKISISNVQSLSVVSTLNWIPSNITLVNTIQIDPSNTSTIWMLGVYNNTCAVLNVNILTSTIQVYNYQSIDGIQTSTTCAMGISQYGEVYLYNNATYKLYKLVNLDVITARVAIPSLPSILTVSPLLQNGYIQITGGGVSGYMDGRGSTALFNSVNNMIIDSNGTLYLTDSGNSAIRIIKVQAVVSPTTITIHGNVTVPNVYASTITGFYMDATTLVGITTPSDKRLKNDIKPISDALLKVRSLRGVLYKWKGDIFKKYIGCIAQEVENVLPEVIYTDNSAEQYKSIYYGEISVILIEAIKELNNRLDVLEKRMLAIL